MSLIIRDMIEAEMAQSGKDHMKGLLAEWDRLKDVLGQVREDGQ